MIQGARNELNALVRFRSRLMKLVICFMVAFVCCFMLAEHIFAILIHPALTNAGPETFQLVTSSGESALLAYSKVGLSLLAYSKIGLFGALFLTLPLIAGQLYATFAPNFYKRGRMAFLLVPIASFVLFVTGGTVACFFLMPEALKLFLAGVHPVIELSYDVHAYLNLTMFVIISTGLCFQAPALLVLLRHHDDADHTPPAASEGIAT